MRALIVLALLTVSAYGEETATTPGPQRYQLYPLTIDVLPVGQQQTAMRLDTETGRTWIYYAAIKDGVMHQGWLAVPEPHTASNTVTTAAAQATVTD